MLSFSVAEFDALPECLSPSDGEQASSQPIDVQEEEERDEDPAVKTYLRAGLYSDDYKTTEYVDTFTATHSTTAAVMFNITHTHIYIYT